MGKCRTAAEAVAKIRSGHRVFIHGATATPLQLVQAMTNRAPELKDVEIIHIHTAGTAPYARPEYAGSFRVLNMFIGANMRSQLDYDRVDFMPIFLSEMPNLFRSGLRAPDVALIHVSPPDIHGFCTLGVSVDTTKAAVDTAKIVIAQINPNMPRAHGDGFIHVSKITDWIEVDDAIPEWVSEAPTDVEMAIGRHAASLIEDGSTLQMGIGGVPDAVLLSLKNHKHLGIHTEMWSNYALDLILSGAVDNSKKTVHPYKTVSTFATGNKRVYDWLHDNPSMVQLECSYTNSPAVIKRNPKMVAINSAIEVDLTGQVCADSIGHRMFSGVGGQVDFIRGAALSEGGKPIIALPSRTHKGQSRLVPSLKLGAGVVTTRYHVHYIITEYGIAHLVGKSLSERAKALINIAHPDDREPLDRAWHDVMKSVSI